MMPDTISWRNRYQVHLNSIKAIEMIQISREATLVMSGGDDNALAVSLLEENPNHAAGAIMSTVSIPDAHASAITTVRLLQHRRLAGSRTETLVASSGSDHRMKMWTISIDLVKQGTESITILERINRYVPVGDISCMDILQHPQGDNAAEGPENVSKIRLLVCGVGMELLDVNLA
jgi:WD repeat-containing protein 6